MEIPQLSILLSFVVMVSSQNDHMEHVHKDHTINMDAVYCNGKGYNDAQEIQLTKDTNWHVIWSGYGVGDGDFCGVTFTRSDKNMTDPNAHTMCITPEVFNISDCDSTVEFYEIENDVSGMPSQVFNCTHGLRAPFCTKKTKLKIIVESLSDSDSEFQLHIEAPQFHISDNNKNINSNNNINNNNNNNNSSGGSNIHSLLSTSLVIVMFLVNSFTL